MVEIITNLETWQKVVAGLAVALLVWRQLSPNLSTIGGWLKSLVSKQATVVVADSSVTDANAIASAYSLLSPFLDDATRKTVRADLANHFLASLDPPDTVKPEEPKA